MAGKSVSVQYDFPFFAHLRDFYVHNRGRIRQHYRELTKKYLDFNDPNNSSAFLRRPQFEALEMYVFLKEFLDNRPVHELFREWADQTGGFEGRGFIGEYDTTGTIAQFGMFEQPTRDVLDIVYSQLRAATRAYPNYLFALTMGTGKTILMAACIFYEFILANKFPKDPKYCHNALVFAPDTTVLESLREIQTFDKSRVVPPEYVSWLDANIRFHFLDEAGMTLNVLDQSRFNLIISNTQKVILKRQHKAKSPMEQLMLSREQTQPAGSVYDEFSDLYGDPTEIADEAALTTNQRFQKLQRLTQLGIFVDEAHHAFGARLAEDVGASENNSKATSLRLTIDELATSLKRAGSHVVACYNYTGTPYVQNRILPEVVYAFGLSEAIQREYLKQVRVHGYTNARTAEFVEQAIGNFLNQNDLTERHEGLLPKIAFFAATIEELQNELRPAVEHALIKRGIPVDSILVNVGDPKLTSNDDIREFRNLDKPDSTKQFILLVNKGREGWNCRSLFGVALYRKPKSKIFVLQASMRCLRSIGEAQRTGHVYLSDENIQILEEELAQNFRLSVEQLVQSGAESKRVTTRVKVPVEQVKLTRVRKLFQMHEKHLTERVNLDLANADTEKYRLLHTQHEGLTARKPFVKTEDISAAKERRIFSRLTLVAEVARYLNRSCLDIDRILASTVEGVDAIVARVNEFNELLYDHVIPKLFQALYDVIEYEHHEVQVVDLVKVPAKGYYEMSAKPMLIVTEADAPAHPEKSFHLDIYCFDSGPEKILFEYLLKDPRVRKVYFTGMLTHGQSDFFVQYVDPESHTIRSYYPDFLLEDADGKYIIVEVKADYQVDAPVVVAKQTFAEQSAAASNMSYCLLKASDADSGHYEVIWHPERREAYLQAIIAEQPTGLFD